MSNQEDYPMVSVALSNDVRHALKLLKKKYKVSQMNEAIRLVLSEHEPDALKSGVVLADMERKHQRKFEDESA